MGKEMGIAARKGMHGRNDEQAVSTNIVRQTEWGKDRQIRKTPSCLPVGVGGVGSAAGSKGVESEPITGTIFLVRFMFILAEFKKPVKCNLVK